VSKRPLRSCGLFEDASRKKKGEGLGGRCLNLGGRKEEGLAV